MIKSSKNRLSLLYPLILFILCFISKFFLQAKILVGESTGQALFGAIILQCAVFLIPSAIYFKCVTQKKSIRREKPSFPLCVSITLWGCFSMIGAYSLLCPISFPYTAIVLSRIDTFYLAMSYCLFPALCEEIAFRYCLYDMLDSKGVFNKIIITSLLFSMIHFSAWQLPVLFFGSLIFGTVREITDSVVYSAIVHFAYNVFVIFFSSALNAIYIKTSASFYYILFSAILLASLFMFSDRLIKYIKHVSSAKHERAEIARRSTKENITILTKTVISPPFICCVLIFLSAIAYQAFIA